MNQPLRATPTNSPTPSKSSLRQTSGSQNPSQRSLIPPPSPRFEDQPAVPVRYSPRSPPNQTLDYESDEDDEPLIYPDPPPVEDNSYLAYPEPERPFQPFFTLIEDGLTSEHHHPSVHYIFADDDTELITEAALRSLEQDDLNTSPTDKPTQPSHIEPDSRLPFPTPGVREHYLILDIHPTPQATAPLISTSTSTSVQPQTQPQPQPQSSTINPTPPTQQIYTIITSTSLSPTWQISSAQITSAPTMSDTPGEDEGLMLRISGRSFTDTPPKHTTETGTSRPDEKSTGKGRESLEEMIERFQAQLGEVKKLIETDGLGGNVYRGAVGGGDAAVDAVEDESAQGLSYGLEEQD